MEDLGGYGGNGDGRDMKVGAVRAIYEQLCGSHVGAVFKYRCHSSSPLADVIAGSFEGSVEGPGLGPR